MRLPIFFSPFRLFLAQFFEGRYLHIITLSQHGSLLNGKRKAQRTHPFCNDAIPPCSPKPSGLSLPKHLT